MTRKVEQLTSTLHRAVQQVIDKGLGDPRIAGLITVTGIRVAADLRDATVSVSIIPEDREDLTMHGLRDAARHVRRQVGDLVAMHRVPNLLFKLDRSMKAQAGVIAAINKATAELAEKQKQEPSGAIEEAS